MFYLPDESLGYCVLHEGGEGGDTPLKFRIRLSLSCVAFCKYIKRYMFPGNQGTHDNV